MVDPINIFESPWRPHPRQNALQALAAAPANGVAAIGEASDGDGVQ